jgi:hypothetical protein
MSFTVKKRRTNIGNWSPKIRVTSLFRTLGPIPVTLEWLVQGYGLDRDRGEKRLK